MSCWGKKGWSRRRLLCVAAAACGLPFVRGTNAVLATGDVNAFEWRGVALGAPARITLLHPDAKTVRRVVRICLDEIARFESIFSLYCDWSELACLNRRGRLRNPSLDLRALLEESQYLGRLTDGAFDVTVQPLWQVYAGHFRERGPDATGPDEQTIEKVRRRIDYRELDIGRHSVGFLRPGMAATLNGIGQGAITDRIADILRNEGFDRTLVDLGEIAALDPPPNRLGWRVAIDDPFAPGHALEQLDLANHAIATSAGGATRFDATGRHHHLFDPATGRSASRHKAVSVISGSATLSDALSTALSILPTQDAAVVLRKSRADRALIVAPDGTARWISGT